MKLTELS